MKRLVIVSLFLIACLCMNGFITVPATEIAAQPDASDITASAAPDADLVLKARLENLLNINYIYGDDILDNEKLLNRSAISLKSLADDNGFIKQEAVVAFIKDLYDIDLVITDDMTPELPKKEGYVYLIPRGYTKYSHTVMDISHEDDILVVTSSVKVSYHDEDEISAVATTLFIENPESSFGYSILNSDISYSVCALIA